MIGEEAGIVLPGTPGGSPKVLQSEADLQPFSFEDSITLLFVFDDGEII